MGRGSDARGRRSARRQPRPPLVLRHRVASQRVVVSLTVIAVVLVAALWMVETGLLQDRIVAVDERGVQWAAQQRDRGSLEVARMVSHLGDLWVVSAVGAGLVAIARLRAGRWDSARLVALAVGGALVVTAVAKELTGRERPEEAVTATVSLAFPSGHAARAAVVYALIAWLAVRWSKHPVTPYAVGVTAFAMALATGWSRVLLGAHWPTDVIAGWALGCLWLTAVIALTRPEPLGQPIAAVDSSPSD